MKARQLSDLLRRVIPQRHPVLISGEPGVGKTALVAAVAAELDHRLVVSHPVISDPTDFKGMPWVTEGEAAFLPIGEVRELMNTSEPTVWLIDDLGQAPLAVQAALMQLIHGNSRQLGGHRLGDRVSILACTNRHQDRAGVVGFLEPVKSRFITHVELEPDLDDWTAWAFENGIDPLLPAFLRWRPELLAKFDPSLGLSRSPSPRAWEHVSNLLALDLPADVELEVLTGAVGQGAATELAAFLRVFHQLPDPELVVAEPELAPLPDVLEPSARFAACGAMAARVEPQTLVPVLQYFDRMEKEFQVLFVHLATQRQPELTSTRAYVEWATQNSEVLS